MSEIPHHNLPPIPEPLPWESPWIPKDHEPKGYDLVKADLNAAHARFSHDAMTAYEDYLNVHEGISEEELATSVNGLLKHTRGAPASEEEIQEMGGFSQLASELRHDISEEREKAQSSLAENTLSKHEQLKQTREDIKLMDESPRGKLLVNEYFENLKKPKLFEKWREMDAAITGGEEKPWMDWLVKDATDDQLLNIMQWHTDRLKKFNTDPHIRAEIEARRAACVKGLDALVEQGYVHPDVAYRIDRVKHVGIYAADPLEMHFERIRGEAFPHKNYVVMLPEVMLDEERKTFEHELSHLVVSAPEQWADEVGCDYFAGAVRSGSPDAVDALMDAAEDITGYTHADLKLVKLLVGDDKATKAFARYITAPIEEKIEARHAFCAALASDQDPGNLWEALNVVMTKHLKYGIGETDHKEDLSARA